MLSIISAWVTNLSTACFSLSGAFGLIHKQWTKGSFCLIGSVDCTFFKEQQMLFGVQCEGKQERLLQNENAIICLPSEILREWWDCAHNIVILFRRKLLYIPKTFFSFLVTAVIAGNSTRFNPKGLALSLGSVYDYFAQKILGKLFNLS